MSKECSSSLNETKPQRSFFQRLIHSTLFRSCWSTTQPALEESALASTSLLREQSTKYDSYKNITSEDEQLKQEIPALVEQVIVDSSSTSGSDDEQAITTADSSMLKDDKVPTGTSLADYLRAESHNSGTDEEADKLTPMQPEEQLTEWERFTTLPGVRMLKRPKDQLYEDLIANSLDDYDEKTEEEYEIQHRNNDEPVQFGPITREEFIRLTFCRIRRHNARSKLQNDTPKSYYFSAQVGEGSFSTVYEAFRTQDRKQYAIKVANKRQIQRERKVQYVVREKDIMATLKYGFKGNPFIAGICCTFQEEDKLYYVMEYASNGELLMWLRRLGSFDLPTSQFYASEIASALEYIHECGCIHRDLKPENILIKSDWHIMLSDFGSAKVIGFGGDDQIKSQLKPIKQRSTFVGTAQYLSPEVASGRSCGPESDFWALGAIIFQMISGQPPFRGINAYQILQKVNKLQYKFPDGFDDIAKDLVKRLLVPEIETRLGHNGINDIKMHDFFKEVNWDCIFTRKPPELKPYLPASCGEPEFYSNISASEMETGLSNAVISRLMGLSSQQRPAEKDSQRNTSLERKKVPEISHEEKIEIQRREHLYHNFVDDSLIVKSGLIDKKKGLFARRRMFLLTQNGRLFYVDPVRKVLKGEIPLSKNVATETKNFRTFFVHTPTRTYFLFDPERRAIDWCTAIEQVRDSVYGKPSLDELSANMPNQRCNKKQFKSSVSN